MDKNIKTNHLLFLFGQKKECHVEVCSFLIENQYLVNVQMHHRPIGDKCMKKTGFRYSDYCVRGCRRCKQELVPR